MEGIVRKGIAKQNRQKFRKVDCILFLNGRAPIIWIKVKTAKN